MKPTNASAGHGHSPEEFHNDDVAHEHSDINISALVWSMVVMFGVVVVTAGLMLLLFNFFESEAKARDPKLSPLAMQPTTMPPTTTASPFFGGAPEPKLMTGEPMFLKEVRTAEQAQLHGYGWVDEKGGVARIPIDEAKKLTLERGLSVRPDPLTDPRLGTRTPASGESSSGRTITRPLAAGITGSAGTGHARDGARRAQVGSGVQGSGFRVQGSGFRVQGSGFRVQGSTRGRAANVSTRRRTPYRQRLRPERSDFTGCEKFTGQTLVKVGSRW